MQHAENEGDLSTTLPTDPKIEGKLSPIYELLEENTELRAQGADPPPTPLHVAAAEKKSFERGNYSPLPHWDSREILPSHIKFRTCSALAPM